MPDLNLQLLSDLDLQLVLSAILYLAIGGAYLVVVPALLYFYLQNRWNVAGSVERTFLYGMVFVFFPGLLLLSPFLNFRPKKRQLQG
ncbi:MAG: NAD(P)H-quinone oxidoreductase subunit L [Leptolyngbyaceae cyanobacterium MO_188.B28]|nr:NAD(P)H-quinone oxidoreductase subunit L [Leptolyngbyaceae cyanobacterium MO_188.B28]